MGLWSSITSIFGKKDENEEVKMDKKQLEWTLTEKVVVKAKDTNRKFVTYSIRKYLGSKANRKKVEKAGFKTLSTKNKFSDYVLSARICLNKKQPIKLLKSPMGFPVKFPLITDLITILDYSIQSYKGKK
jgi:hypothetical protein